ncbi:endonuclease domain-containing protein [Arenimonas daejeonensis]|uniref:endonuclease domain-containing protein n=1 Tax=Arenimonas daejeonensis TaxID=370777 RepID=UPI0011BE4E91|nr:endonuclease domain-containing protein [Arenimonas daejeonensis]
MPGIRQFARTLRNSSTDAERRLWRHLRNRQLLGLRFRRQHPIVGFIADFACVEARLVIELDGGQHADAREYDLRRTEILEGAGYRVLRFWNHDVLLKTDDVLAEIFRQVLTPPQPSPAGRGGGRS